MGHHSCILPILHHIHHLPGGDIANELGQGIAGAGDAPGCHQERPFVRSSASERR
jgi:hypothetical protein